MTAHVAAKVARLLKTARVMPADGAIYRVRGESGTTYTVVLGDSFEHCSCPAGARPVPCSHLAASRLLHEQIVLQAAGAAA